MTDVYRFSEIELLFFFMVLVRMSAFVVSWPVFGVENVSQQIKILLALVITMVVFPTLTMTAAQGEALKGDLGLLVVREVFVGLSLGFLARLFFFSFRVAGEMLSQAMGLTSAQVYNPTMGGQITSVEQYYVTLASFFYLAVNGHHFLISGLVDSYQWVPPATLSLNVSQFVGVGHMVQEVIELGLKMSAPVVVSILVVNLVLGVVGKTVPQLNVLITSFPINIMVGFFLMFVTLPLMLDQMGDFLQLSTARVFQFVRAF